MDTSIFAPDVFTTDVKFLPSDREFKLAERSVRSQWERIAATAAAVAVSGVLAFYQPPADLTKAELTSAVSPARAARPVPRHAPIPPGYLKVIEDYRARHVEMPPTDADRRIRPYYGI